MCMLESLFRLRAVYPFIRKVKFSVKLHAKDFVAGNYVILINKHFWSKCKVAYSSQADGPVFRHSDKEC